MGYCVNVLKGKAGTRGELVAVGPPVGGEDPGRGCSQAGFDSRARGARKHAVATAVEALAGALPWSGPQPRGATQPRDPAPPWPGPPWQTRRPPAAARNSPAITARLPARAAIPPTPTGCWTAWRSREAEARARYRRPHPRDAVLGEAAGREGYAGAVKASPDPGPRSAISPRRSAKPPFRTTAQRPRLPRPPARDR